VALRRPELRKIAHANWQSVEGTVKSDAFQQHQRERSGGERQSNRGYYGTEASRIAG